MKTTIEGEANPVEIISLDEHWLEADEERDYTVTFIRSEKVMRFIEKEEYLKLCEAMNASLV